MEVRYTCPKVQVHSTLSIEVSLAQLVIVCIREKELITDDRERESRNFSGLSVLLGSDGTPSVHRISATQWKGGSIE
jgi:hypothetical protein